MLQIEIYHFSSRINIKLKLVVLIASIMLFGCGADINIPALRNCDSSGMAYYDKIPLASRSEHEQAQRFRPLNNGNCQLYVIGKRDALITLRPAEPFRVSISIYVYAMWELPPSTYHLSASLGNRNETAQVDVDCRPSDVRFIAVRGRGINDDVVLEDITEEEGRAFVQNGLRSVGFRKNINPFLKDCSQGLAETQYSLGVMYFNGQGAPQNYTEAFKWYKKAADQGHVEAQYYLGVMYGKGQGAQMNFIDSYVWLSIASKNGHEASKKALETLSTQMAPQQIAQAQKKADELWKLINKSKK